jgi:N-acyl-D-amino-acid deacylase
MFDVVINNGVLVDPVDGQQRGSIGINGGKIAAISPGNLRGKKEIDAAGHAVSPGFIDIHMHTEPPFKKNSYEVLDYMALMGVTTAIGGNCGIGEGDISSCTAAFQETGNPINFASLIGHAGLRELVGCHDRYQPVSDDKIAGMGEILKKGLEQGALGLSFGLEYVPGTSFKEMLYLSEIVAAFPGRLVSAHYRYDAERALEALAEMIIIARETKVRFQVSHIGSCAALSNRMSESLKMLESAHKAGIDIMADVYPYDAFCTIVGSAVFDPGCFERWGVGYDAILAAEGKYKGERCTEETFTYLRDHEPEGLVVAFVMNEDEVVEAMVHPLVMVASDGHIREGQGHPRGAGTFPRLLGRYVRERGNLDLVTAIRKITLLPARQLGLTKKGRILEGYDADITIFDPETVIDESTFQEPAKAPRGIERVLVDGIEVALKGQLTGNKPGVYLTW